METRCEHCGQDCWVEDERAGEEVTCPVCEHAFVAKEPPENLLQIGSLVDLMLAEMPAVTTVLAPQPTKAKTNPVAYRRRRVLAGTLILGMAGVALCSLTFAAYRGVAWAISRAGNVFSDRGMHATDTGPTVWRPNASVQAFLGKPKVIEGFMFNPPEGFDTFTNMRQAEWTPREGHFVGLQWQGAAGEKAQMRCWIVTFSEVEPLTGGLEEALDRCFGWLKHNGAIVRFSSEPAETGMINKLPCIRASFTGHYRAKGAAMPQPREGVVYILIDGKRQICLYTLCDPTAHDVGVIMDASWMTWRRP